MMGLQVSRGALLALLLAASTAVAAPLKERYAVKDSFHVPKGWSRISDAPKDHVINLSIAVKQSQVDELERHLNEVSDPFHSRYGQHLSAEEVNELVKPSTETSSLVHEWLSNHGISKADLSYSPAGDWISIELPVAKIESLLDTKYSVYEHTEGGYIVRTPEWSLPEHLHEHVETIQPTNSFFRAKAMKKTMKPADLVGGLPAMTNLASLAAANLKSGATVAEVCNVTNVTPQCLRTLYGTIDYTPTAAGKNKVGLTDYLGESNNRSDTKIFLDRYRPDASSAAYGFQVVVINGGDDQQTPNTPAQNTAGKDLEGNLDIQTILAFDYPTPAVAFTTGGQPPFQPDTNTPTNTNEPYLIWLQYVLAQSSLPQTISTSYGDDEQTVPYSYAKTVCNGFMQLGARGITLLFSSGDNGVGADDTCTSNDGKNTPMFIPSFPATCPYVTVVGATKNFQPEVAAYDASNGFSSGGGFSNYFSRPTYQAAAVAIYLASLNSSYAYPGLYNKSGRAYPDIAAQGQRYAVIWDGRLVHLDGTSASSPCAAGVLSLVNDALITIGRPPLGFLNPWLYTIGFAGFTDITSGSTLGCNSDGFPAAKGWDAVTGFGTPYFPRLKDLAILTKYFKE